MVTDIENCFANRQLDIMADIGHVERHRIKPKRWATAAICPSANGEFGRWRRNAPTGMPFRSRFVIRQIGIATGNFIQVSLGMRRAE
jgi:hypothetical protein